VENNFLNNGFVVLDGAMGTVMQRMGLKTGRYPELLNLDNPEAIAKIHREYSACGSNVV
jgi:5-methyltetrahydrofolate--homocysteine methyltransferase